MESLFYPAYGHLEIANRPVPEVARDEVLLEVAACGLCGSELETFKNQSPRRKPPLVMGHEFCGTVMALGSEVRDLTAGRRMVSNALVPCDRCARCKRGDTHLCADRQVFGMHRGGAFAQYVNVPVRCLMLWPETLAASAACLAEPLGNGVHVVNLTAHLAAARVLVIGAGPIGLMCQQAMQALRGARVWVTDLLEDRLRVAQRLGAENTFHPRMGPLQDLVNGATENEGFDLVIDAVGSAQTKAASLEATRAGGGVVWIGLHGDEMSLHTYNITLPEKQVLGTYAATLSDLEGAIELMVSGRVDVTTWVQTFPLKEGVEAFHRMLAPQESDLKAVLLP